ncbi:MAG: thiamine pyrophosphate-binding protein, partial [Atribacterota bacterium]
MRMKGAQVIVELLKKEGVDVVFGYPGGAVLDIYDALFDTPEIRHVLVRHEQGAAHAADGYARTTGKVGVCIATSGPGATNLVTGLATAYMDSIPIVALTGQVFTHLIGKDSFQEADTTGITMPITKHNFLVTKAEDLPYVIKEAFYIAATGRPGPVLVDLPRDVQQKMIDLVYPEKIKIPGYRPTYKGHAKQVKLAAEAIQEAKRPLLYVGGGVIASGASDVLFELATKADIPVVHTLMGKG